MALKRKRILKISCCIFIVLLSLSLLIAYLRYLDLKKAFLAKVSQEATSFIGQEVQIEDLSFGPSLSLNLYGITINNPDGFPAGQLLRIKKIQLEIRFKELLRRNLSFKSIEISSPQLTLIADGKGKWNIPDRLLGLLSQKSTKSTGKFELDELSIESGSFHLSTDPRFRSDHIDLRLQNLSSEPGTRTGIKGTIVYAGNKIQIEGWTNLHDVPVKADLTVSSKDFTLSPFRKILEAYKIDTEKTRLGFDMHAEGDPSGELHVTSNVRLKGLGPFPFIRNPEEIRLQADGLFSLRDHFLVINTASLVAGGTSAATFKGQVTGLNKTPSYTGDVKIDRLDLSELHFIKDFKLKGVLTSKGIHIAGDVGAKTPHVSGGLQLKEAGVESPYSTLQGINADILFSSGKEITVKGEASATVSKLGEYTLNKASDAKVSGTLRVASQQIDVSSSFDLSPLELQLKDGTTALLEDSHITVTGILKGNAFSGKSTLDAKGIRVADHKIARLKSGSGIDYLGDTVTLTHLTLEAEEGTLSAGRANITLPRETTGYKIDIKDLNAQYRNGEASLKQCDVLLNLHPNTKSVAGDLHFSAGNVLFQGVSSRNISGRGNLDGKNFSLDIDRAEVFGGKVKLRAEGQISESFFPMKANLLAEGIDLTPLSRVIPKSMAMPYHLAGNMKKATFDGIINSYQSLNGSALLETGTLSFSNSSTGQDIVKDISLKGSIEFKDRDLAFRTDTVSGKIVTQLSGTVKGFAEKERTLQIKGTVPEIRLTEIRESFWDLFPDRLLYAGLEGSVSSDFSIDYGKNRLAVNGSVNLKDCFLKGEYGEYSIGPINGRMPIAYGKDRGEGEPASIPTFEKTQFDVLTKYYAKEIGGKDLQKITIGSLEYGFPLLKDIYLRVSQRGSTLKIERFGANIFGGRLEGSAFVDLSKGLNYRAGFLIKGLSLTTLCNGIQPIKGFLSGKIDGLASLKGTGMGLSHLIGMADFWTYSAGGEKMMVSKEFLQKMGGPSVKTYLGNRSFDKGIMGLYLQNGDLVFKELEISNRNFIGMTDLSVKVAPLNNRIALDKFLWTITEAAERAKEKK